MNTEQKRKKIHWMWKPRSVGHLKFEYTSTLTWLNYSPEKYESLGSDNKDECRMKIKENEENGLFIDKQQTQEKYWWKFDGKSLFHNLFFFLVGKKSLAIAFMILATFSESHRFLLSLSSTNLLQKLIINTHKTFFTSNKIENLKLRIFIEFRWKKN